MFTGCETGCETYTAHSKLLQGCYIRCLRNRRQRSLLRTVDLPTKTSLRHDFESYAPNKDLILTVTIVLEEGLKSQQAHMQELTSPGQHPSCHTTGRKTIPGCSRQQTLVSALSSSNMGETWMTSRQRSTCCICSMHGQVHSAIGLPLKAYTKEQQVLSMSGAYRHLSVVFALICSWRQYTAPP